jgi:hypothetical protein
MWRLRRSVSVLAASRPMLPHIGTLEINPYIVFAESII